MTINESAAIEASNRLLERVTDADKPGLAVRILKGDTVVFEGTRGLAVVEHDIPIAPKTALRIGSSTKHLACALALLLAREGKIDIEAPVNQYLPELPDYPVKPTIRQVMDNTSGTCDFLELLTASGAGIYRPVPWPTSCELVVRQKHLNSVPGEEFIYSAGGFLVLCMIIERVTGRTTEDLMDEMLFQPLGMKESVLLVNDRELVKDMATPYIELPSGEVVKGGWGLEAKGEGGVVSTIRDMGLWMRELLNPKVLGADLVSTMIEPLTYNNGVRGKYGLGLYSRSFNGWKAFGHGGRTPGMRAELAAYPDADLSIVVLTNRAAIDPFAVGQELAAIWLGWEKPAPAPRPADEIAGTFVNEAGNDFVEIQVRDGLPCLATTAGFIPMRWEQEGWVPQYSVLDMKFTATPSGIENLSSGTRRAYKRTGPAPNVDPDDYVGDYRREDLGSTYHVTCSGDQLLMRMAGELGYFDTKLVCVAPDLFRAPPTNPQAVQNQPLIFFERDSDGAIRAILYSTDRTKNLRFGRL